jgi:hypothetical protein
MTLFMATTVAKPRPSVTPWNQEIAAAEYLFRGKGRVDGSSIAAARPGQTTLQWVLVAIASAMGTGYEALHRRLAPANVR